MTAHARQRLKERYNIPVSDFYRYYEDAIKTKQFFVIDNEDAFRKPYNSISIVFKIGGNRIASVAIDKRNGNIRTIMRPHQSHIEEAKKRGWVK